MVIFLDVDLISSFWLGVIGKINGISHKGKNIIFSSSVQALIDRIIRCLYRWLVADNMITLYQYWWEIVGILWNNRITQ